MKCKNCGEELRENAKFCVSCGEKVENETTEELIEEVEEPKVTKEEVVETIKEAKTISENNKKSKLPLILIILVMLGIGGYYVYNTFFANKAAIVRGLINGMYDKFEEAMNSAEDFDMNKDSILIDGDFSIDSNIEELKDLKDLKITYTTGIDYKNKKMEIGAGLVEDDEKIIEALMYVLNNKAYLDLKDYYDSLIKIDNDELDFDQAFSMSEVNFNNDDIKYLVKAYKDILIESLDMNDFEESSDEIEIGGKDTKVKTLEYELTFKGIEKLAREMTKRMLKDKKLIAKLAKISGVDEEDIKDSLEQVVDSESYDGDDIKIGTISIYVQGFNNEFVGIDMKTETSKIELRKNGKETKITIKSNDNKMTFVIREKSKDSLEIEFKMEEIKCVINIESKKEDKKNYKGKISVSFENDGNKVSIGSNYKIKVGANIANIDTKKAKNMEDISEKELKEIGNKIEKKLKNTKLYDLIEGYFTNINSYGIYQM